MRSAQHHHPTSHDDFMVRETHWSRPPLCPELELGLAPDPETLRMSQEAAFGAGRPFPYWAVAWPAGQALARLLLDEPARVRDATVLDLGAGSGIAAIAAARAGARRVVACDHDAFSLAGIARNARRNGVGVETAGPGFPEEAQAWDVLLAADLWYEPFFARAATGWLAQQRRRGSRVLLADSGRAHFRRPHSAPLASVRVPASERLEPSREVTVAIWQLDAGSPAATGAAR